MDQYVEEEHRENEVKIPMTLGFKPGLKDATSHWL